MSMDKELATSVVINLVRSGSSLKDACHQAGVGYSTFFRWKAQNPDLSSRVKKAESDGKQWHIQNIRKHAEKDWKASAWFLERKFPREYGKRVINIEPKQSEASGGILVKVPEPRSIETRTKAEEDGV